MSNISYRGGFAFFGMLWCDDLFSSRAISDNEKLENWCLLAIFSHFKGWVWGLGDVARAGRWLEGGVRFWWPAFATSPKDHPLKWLKIANKHQFSSFSSCQKLLDLKINHSITISPKNANPPQYEMPKCRSSHFTLGSVNFTLGGNIAPTRWKYPWPRINPWI